MSIYTEGIVDAQSTDAHDMTEDSNYFMTDPEDESKGLQMISIRFPKEEIELCKIVAQYHEMGYQPLIRAAVKRFLECEFREIAIKTMTQKVAEKSKPGEKRKLRSSTVNTANALKRTSVAV